MWLKIIIVVLFIALVISLFSGLIFLFQDRENENEGKSRVWSALTIRLVLAGLLVATLVYGVFTGQLGSNAPWDERYEQKLQPQATNPADSENN